MEKYNGHTPLPWVADLRGGCCAVYHKDRKKDTNGLHADDSRNIIYSNRDSHKVTDKEGIHWEMDVETQHNFAFIVEACNNYYRLKEQKENLNEVLKSVKSIIKLSEFGVDVWVNTVKSGEQEGCRAYALSLIDKVKEAIKSCQP